ncbi:MULTISPECIES: electron transport complex subunit RsxA [Candidatus Ichthyocystis]|uniref:Ion-translocating oxidoreductase complex subunit A n=1 Tax=Candidatus Ichthyocystis hellenicum TaxID=1561003 RepID=A0A0S4LZC5_9BURK|nr:MULTISPECIES: electron transport complex subunit RsxA [Ichthyocystis]CUT16917.1 putative electron transport complex protein RnfA [Candidatus Ichthyocystis hellenicum]
MSHNLSLLIETVLVDNVILSQILGLCPFLGLSKKWDSAVGMGAATSFVLTIGCGTSYMIDHYLLIPYHVEFLRTLSFIVVIAGVVQLTEQIIQVVSPILHRVLGIYLPLITTNCAVLGIPLLNSGTNHNLVESLIFGFGNSIGFTLVLLIFSSMRERIEAADVPNIFRGNSIALMTAGLLGIAFSGFAGLVKIT